MDAPGSPPTRLTIVPDKWVQPTRRPTDQSVGPTNLVGSPHVCLEDLREDFLDDLVQHDCRMDLPGPATLVGTRTDYSVGPWDYLDCAARHLKAWSTRTTQE
jgi:hypothetical protein